jgi:hypothetical protein
VESRIATTLQLIYQPTAILWSDEKPDDAVQFVPALES